MSVAMYPMWCAADARKTVDGGSHLTAALPYLSSAEREAACLAGGPSE